VLNSFHAIGLGEEVRMKRLSIGKMAEMNGVSVQALRLYDRLGLLKPACIDEASGYRYYDIRQCARLDAIGHLKALGMPLREIGSLFEGKEAEGYRNLLEAQAGLIEKRRIELEVMARALDRARENLRRFEEAPSEGFVVIERLEARRIFSFDGGVDIYEGGIEAYEEVLRRLKAHVALEGLPPACFCNVGSIVRLPLLESRTLRSTELFILIDDGFSGEALKAGGGAAIESVGAGTYACIYFQGFDRELHFADILLDSIGKQGLRIAGDYLCEVVTELPLFPQDMRTMFIKLQIPVSFQ
jgi:DNA-binding transcriptional MerR regulator